MKVEIIEGDACPNRIHLLVSIPPYMSVAQFTGTLKSKSALTIFDRHANLTLLWSSLWLSILVIPLVDPLNQAFRTFGAVGFTQAFDVIVDVPLLSVIGTAFPDYRPHGIDVAV